MNITLARSRAEVEHAVPGARSLGLPGDREFSWVASRTSARRWLERFRADLHPLCLQVYGTFYMLELEGRTQAQHEASYCSGSRAQLQRHAPRFEPIMLDHNNGEIRE